MNRPVRSPLALRACPQATDLPLPCLPCTVVPARPSHVSAALCVVPAISYDMGYAR